MPEIVLRENKLLELTNVLSCPIPYNDILTQIKQPYRLNDFIKTNGYEAIGPVILYVSGVNRNDEMRQTEAKLMLQINTDDVRLEPPFAFEKGLRVERCLLTRFEGTPENLLFLINQLSCYAEKHDFMLTGELYVIFIEHSENQLVADIFMTAKKAQTI